MTGSFFLDASALIKLYHQEPGSERVEEIFEAASATVIISELTGVELYSAFARRVRGGEISVHAGDLAVRTFEQDCANRFIIEPLSPAVIQQAKTCLRPSSPERGLRALDALQLSTVLLVRAREEVIFVCADNRLCEVAAAEGLQVLNPEMPAS